MLSTTRATVYRTQFQWRLRGWSAVMLTHRADPRPNHIPSSTFRVSGPNGVGYVFKVQISPYGEAENEDGDFVSAFLKLTSPVADEKVQCVAGFTFCLVNGDRSRDLVREVIAHEFNTGDEFAGTWGWPKFIKREDLSTSGYLQNDTLAFDIEVRMGETNNPAHAFDTETAFAPILCRDMRLLFKEALHTDVIIRPTPPNAITAASTTTTPVKPTAAAAAGASKSDMASVAAAGASTAAAAFLASGRAGGSSPLAPAATASSSTTAASVASSSAAAAGGGATSIAAAGGSISGSTSASSSSSSAGGGGGGDLLALDSSSDRHAHRGILAARSPVFRAMFSAGFKESKENIVEMRYSPIVCDAFLEYMYTGDAKHCLDMITTWELSVQLLQASDFYAVPELADVAVSLIRKYLTPQNAVVTLRLAAALLETTSGGGASTSIASSTSSDARSHTPADRLKTAVRQYMGDNLDAIVSVLANPDLPLGLPALPLDDGSGASVFIESSQKGSGRRSAKQFGAAAPSLASDSKAASSASRTPAPPKRKRRAGGVHRASLQAATAAATTATAAANPLIPPPPPIRVAAYTPPGVRQQHEAALAAHAAAQAAQAVALAAGLTVPTTRRRGAIAAVNAAAAANAASNASAGGGSAARRPRKRAAPQTAAVESATDDDVSDSGAGDGAEGAGGFDSDDRDDDDSGQSSEDGFIHEPAAQQTEGEVLPEPVSASFPAATRRKRKATTAAAVAAAAVAAAALALPAVTTSASTSTSSTTTTTAVSTKSNKRHKH